MDNVAGWVHDENFEVEAKMDSAVLEALRKLSPQDQTLARQHMLQTTLQDRFKLAVHAEPREVDGYDLVIGKNGPKFKAAQTGVADSAPDRGLAVSTTSDGAVQWDAHDTELSPMLTQLAYEVGKPVWDKTGLTGRYDFTVRFASERTMNPSGPAQDTAPLIKTALQDQLGLKLVPAKGNLDYIVIDHVEKPTSN